MFRWLRRFFSCTYINIYISEINFNSKPPEKIFSGGEPVSKVGVVVPSCKADVDVIGDFEDRMSSMEIPDVRFGNEYSKDEKR